MMKDLLVDVHSWSDLGAKLWPLLVPFVLKILACIVVYMVGRKLIKALNKITDKMMSRKDFDPSIASFIRSLINISL
ncbi:MAG: mechanosensitive ion channel family protein, partial [Dysgonamonadaceae bacterium]|nr:mechanosensitive ion channel family protein [Dysgonamonadaceae bacterium]